MELKDLQVGDKVFMTAGNNAGHDSINKITRITDKYIFIGEEKFNRETGDKIKPVRHEYPNIHVVTPEIEERFKKYGRIHNINILVRDLITKDNVDNLEIDNLIEICNVLNTMKNDLDYIRKKEKSNEH